MKYNFVLKAVFLVFLIMANNTFAESLPIKLKKGMPYLKARQILLNTGWQTVVMHITPNGSPICNMSNWDEKVQEISCKYEEIEACSGTGMGFCSMYFFDGEDKYLHIITAGGEPPDAEINSWQKVKKLPNN